MDADAETWCDRAELAQDALTSAFGTRIVAGGLRNTAPWRLRHAFAFNDWWLAHGIEVRIDAFERSGEAVRLQSAVRLLDRLRRRNGGTLVNDYFDDMGWMAIASLRLHRATHDDRYLDDALNLWGHIARAGWNTRHGASVAWRSSQLDYKNAPTNGVFALLSARLFAATGGGGYARAALAALGWISAALVDPASALVTDGVNRRGDAGLDADWLFSYNQGLYLGALVAVSPWRPGSDALDRASRTAVAAVARFAPSGVISDENSRLDQRGGADVGLFKGVFVRYVGELIPQLPAASDDRRLLVEFVRTSTDALWSGMRDAPGLCAADDWRRPAPRVTALSTQLSAVMALETRARLERHRAMRVAPVDENGLGSAGPESG